MPLVPSDPRRRAAGLLLCTLASGLLAQLAAPPLALSWLSLICWAPLLCALYSERSWRVWGGCGLAAGLLWHAAFPRALAGWGTSLVLLAWLLPSLLVAAAFVGCHALRRLSGRQSLWWSFAFSWWLACAGGESWLDVPLASAASIALPPAGGASPVAGLARLVGPWGVELWLALTNAVFADWLRHGLTSRTRSGMLRGALAFASVLAMLPLAARGPAPARERDVVVHAVLPQVPTAEYRAARWSIKARRLLEQRVDALIARAVRREPAGIVVLTEGGNGLLNQRLARRREILRKIVQGGRSEVAFASDDLTPEGVRHNVVSLLDRDGVFREQVRKAHLVPIAEGEIEPGSVSVLHAAAATLAVPICFDAMFSDHALSAVQQGAELIVATTDDASFGPGGFGRWHAAHAVLRALAVGRSIAFVANGENLIAVSHDGRLLHDGRPHEPSVHSLRLPAATGLTLAVQAPWLHALLAGVLLACGMLLVPRASPSPIRVRSSPGALAPAAVLCALMLGPLCDLVTTSRTAGLSLAQLWLDLGRRRDPGSDTAFAPAFHQTRPGTCGFAALAFLLSHLGDDVFEHDLLPAGPQRESYHLGYLVDAARLRGFDALGVSTTWEGLPERFGQAPVVAHFRAGHFVTVLARPNDMVVVFDPAVGNLVHLSRDAFLREWTGRILRVRTREFDAGPLFTVGAF